MITTSTQHEPCILNIYKNCLFVTINNKRFIFNNNTNKIERNRVLERDLSEEEYIKYETQINEQLESCELEELKDIFLFTENYGDRNICHWMTEQLMVLNYLVDLIQNESSCKNKDKGNVITVLINKNRRKSMKDMIMDYVTSIPDLNHNQIMDYNIGEEIRAISCGTIYLGDALDCNLTNIHPLWDRLHNMLNIDMSEKPNSLFMLPHQNKMYMSRRNIYQPGKNTNTRILENYNEVSDKIVSYKYLESFKRSQFASVTVAPVEKPKTCP